MNSDKKIYILLTDVHERKVFDIFNILNKNYKQFSLLLFNNTNTKFSLPIVYGQKVHLLRNTNYADFEHDINKAIDKYLGNTLIYFPMIDSYSDLFYTFMKKHPDVLRYRMPTFNEFSTVMNKITFQDFCEHNNIPVPLSFKKEDAARLQQDFMPLIVKPNMGNGAMGITFINSASELSEFENINFNTHLVQERIANTNIEGAFFLMNKGKLVSYYGHKRLRVFPETGGVSVFSQYQSNKQLKELGVEILQKLNWDGIAMIEFLFDEKEQKYKVIEVNPRMWGTWLLSEFANTGFTINYIKLCLNEPTIETVQRENTFIRWFYPFDLFLYFKKRFQIKDFWKINRQNTCYISFTYASFARSLIYIIYFTININSIKRFLKKIGVLKLPKN